MGCPGPVLMRRAAIPTQVMEESHGGQASRGLMGPRVIAGVFPGTQVFVHFDDGDEAAVDPAIELVTAGAGGAFDTRLET